MKFSQALLPTLKEEPKDAELISHKLMIRAGLVRPLAAGIFTYMPLGWRVLKKIENIMREEMDAIGGQELKLPLVQPAEPWRESGRWYSYDQELMRFKDRTERDMVLATTHEEAVTDLVRREVRSYRQLPLMLYQIQIKFRDEPRPRGGLIRVREFIMKDAYSFHANIKDLDEFYPKIYQAYINIFKRCGLDPLVVEADPGLIGGFASHEFMLPNESGEDLFVKCTGCDYAANLANATSQKEPLDNKERELPIEEVATPSCYTIEAVANFLKIPTKKTAKAVFYKVGDQIAFVVIRGDLEVNEAKLARVLKTANFAPATEDEIRSIGAVPGYASPIGLKKQPKNLKVIIDDSIPNCKNLVSGANKEGYHLKNVNYPRDFKADIVTDIATVRDGDHCTRCDAKLQIKRAIELGHLFKLGTRYSEAMGAQFLDKDGKEKPFIMGCYGIGTGRLMAAVIEKHHDERGIIWPLEVAPFDAIILILNTDEKTQLELGNKFYERLRAEKIEVLLDDRDASAGFKFKDAELIGIPLMIVIGPRGIQNKTVELQRRKGGAKREVSYANLENVVEAVKRELASLRGA